MKTLVLHRDYTAIVDDDVFDWANRHEWERTKAGYVVRYAYGVDGKRCVSISLHRLIARAAADEQVHHINGDKSDNRSENLKLMSIKEHSRLHGRVGRPRRQGDYKGVYQSRSGKWYSKIKVDGKQQNLGTYADEREAAIVYNEAALRLFGPGCFQNEV